MGYVIRSVRETGTVTWHCASTHSALAKVEDFRRAEYREITVSTADDRLLSEACLAGMVARELVERPGIQS